MLSFEKLCCWMYQRRLAGATFVTKCAWNCNQVFLVASEVCEGTSSYLSCVLMNGPHTLIMTQPSLWWCALWFWPFLGGIFKRIMGRVALKRRSRPTWFGRGVTLLHDCATHFHKYSLKWFYSPQHRIHPSHSRLSPECSAFSFVVSLALTISFNNTRIKNLSHR